MPDSYLVVTGIPGDSTDDGHAHQISLLSHGFGITEAHSVASSGGGAGAGKPTFSDLIVTKSIDISTVPLIKTLLTGKVLTTVTLYVMQESEVDPGEADGGLQTVGLLETITLTNAYVTKYNQSTLDSPGNPIETISFAFSKIKYDVDGKSIGWDLKANKTV